MARVQVSLSGSTAEITANATAASSRWVLPETYGAVGDGITDDTQAIQDAIDAANGTAPVLFSPGQTYLSQSISITIDNTHLIFDLGSILRKGPDEGVRASQAGLLNVIDASDVLIDIYGELDGNKSRQIATDEEAFADAVITGDVANRIVIDGHGIGKITNSWAKGIFLHGNSPIVRDLTFDGCGLTGFVTDRTCVWFDICPKAVASGIRLTDTILGGVKVMTNSDGDVGIDPSCEGTTVSDCVIDYRGVTMQAGHVLGVEIWPGIGGTWSLVHNCKVFGSETPGSVDCFGISVGERVTVTDCHVIAARDSGGLPITNSIGSGLEPFGHDNIIADCYVYGAAYAISAIGQRLRVKNTVIDNALQFAVSCTQGSGTPTPGEASINVHCIDCGVNQDANTGIIRFDSTCLPGNDLSGSMIFRDNVDASKRIVSVNAKTHIHDFYVLNEMAGSRELIIAMFDNASNSSVVNCEFIGKANTGTAIQTNTGISGVLISGNLFTGYSDPWNTTGSSGKNLITNNRVNCADADGETHGTDTLANNMTL